MLRIAHVVPSLAPAYGGPSTVAVGMASALARRGHETYLVTTDRGGETPMTGELHQAGVRYLMFRENFHAWAYSHGLAKALDSLAPHLDIIHIHSLHLHPTIAAGRAGQRHH